MAIGLDAADPVQRRLHDLAKALQASFPREIDLGLGRLYPLLQKLGNPHLNLPPVIHIAGTNGKGSVAAYLRAILEAAGYAVHVYTSPHLLRFNERIRLAGELIQDQELLDRIQDCHNLCKGEPITFFELTTAAAFGAFRDHPADALILETGMGGRLDATNVVPNPALTVITPISIDHAEYLGDSIAKIAVEKAAIQKPGAISVIGPQSIEALSAIESFAAARGIVLHRCGLEWWAFKAADKIDYRSQKQAITLPLPKLPGLHQIDNAATSLAAAESLTGFSISQGAIQSGILSAEWPARLQRLHRAESALNLPDGCEIWLDGGHNPAAAFSLAETLKSWDARPCRLVWGMLKNKDAKGFISPFQGVVAAVAAVPIEGEDNAATAQELCAIAESAGIESFAAMNFMEAVRALVQKSESPQRVLICGSLYLAGRVLKVWG